MTEASIVHAHIRRLINVLESVNLSVLIPTLAYKATQSQWDSLIIDIMEQQLVQVPFTMRPDVKSMTYLGITILKPDAPPLA